MKQLSRVVCLDFETYYDTQYSLRKLTTESYIRSSLFEPQCLSFAEGNNKVSVVWGYDEIAYTIKHLQVWRDDTTIVAHNSRFDGTILEWVFNQPVNFLLCTQFMSREVGVARLTGTSLDSLARFFKRLGHRIPFKGKEVHNAAGLRLSAMSDEFKAAYGEYCKTDTEITRHIFNLMLPSCSIESLHAMDMTVKMYIRAKFELDKPLLAEYVKNIQTRRETELKAAAAVYTNGDWLALQKAVKSPAKFAALLTKLGYEVPTKVSEKQTETARKKDPSAQTVMIPALSKNDLPFKDMVNSEDPTLSRLANLRLEFNSSIAESRASRFLNMQSPMPVPLQYAKAHPGRSGGDEKINIQNLPKRGGDKTLRYSMKAPAGHKVGGADSSQIEARLNAYASGQQTLLSLFATGGDPYSHTASQIYNIDAGYIKKMAKMDVNNIAKDDPLRKEQYRCYTMRNVGKEAILGLGYGMSANLFKTRLRQQGIIIRPEEDELAAINSYALQLPSGEMRDKYIADALDQYHDNFATQIRTKYHAMYPEISMFWRQCDGVIRSLANGGTGDFGGPNGNLFHYDANHLVMGVPTPGIMLPNGYWILYPELRYEYDDKYNKSGFTYRRQMGDSFYRDFIHGGKMTENLIQGLASAILMWQAIRINKFVPIALNVHDEYMSIYPAGDEEKVEKVYTTIMSKSPPWCPGVPLACEFTSGNNYGEC